MSKSNAAQFDNIEFNPEFKRALDVISSGKSALITGKAGTGKSTLLRYFRHSQDPAPPVIAPTGVAALNVEGLTIHKFFAFPKDIVPQAISDGSFSRGKKYAKELAGVTTLIIDEISMVRADLLDCVDGVLRKYGPKRGEPFGGIQLVLFGDLYQLDPVLTNSEQEWWYDHYGYKTKYFFSAHAMQRFPLEIVELEQVYRQKDAQFINLLDQVRSDQLTKAGLNQINEHFDPDFDPQPESPYIILTTTNRQANRLNTKKLDELPGKLFTSKATVLGDVQPSDWGNIEPTLSFKVGAKVIMINNDPTERWVNGSIGMVTSVDLNEVRVKLVECETTVVVAPHLFEIAKLVPTSKGPRKEVIGSIEQFPFKLSWAITVHRSQGQTLSHVIIDPYTGFFADGHLYVALSRCTSLDGLRLRKKLRPKDLRVSREVLRYLSSHRIPQENQGDVSVAALGAIDTGFNEYNRVIELAAVIRRPDGNSERYSTLVAPMTDIGASVRHEITAQDLSLAPTLSEAWPFFARRLHDCVLVAHDFDFVIRLIRGHLKAEDILHAIPSGICTKEETGLSFDEAYRKAECRSDSAKSALDVAETTLAIFEALVPRHEVVERFDGHEVERSFSRLLFRKSDVQEDDVPISFDFVNGRDSTSIPAIIRYNDAAAWLLACELGENVIRDRLSACRNELDISDNDALVIHDFFVSSLKAAAERDMRIEPHEKRYIEKVCNTLGIEFPQLELQGSQDHIQLCQGIRVCFTGTAINPLTREMIPRSVLNQIAIDWGLEVVESVTKKGCDLLIVADKSTMSQKAKQARKYSIPILSIEEFSEMVGSTPAD